MQHAWGDSSFTTRVQRLLRKVDFLLVKQGSPHDCPAYDHGSERGSVRAELKEGDAHVRELENELIEVNAKRTTRARKYETLQAEANALSDRFELPALKLEGLAAREREKEAERRQMAGLPTILAEGSVPFGTL